jgi:hypothetical protein
MAWRHIRGGGFISPIVLLSVVATVAACGAVGAPKQPQPHQASSSPSSSRTASNSTASGGTAVVPAGSPGTPPHPAPEMLRAFPGTPTYAGEGVWRSAGRIVGGKPSVYETMLVPPGGTARAGIAWMDTNLLSARLYSGSMSPGGGPYKYTAPVARAAARSLVAAFNGGFLMKDAHGGYYTEGRMIRPLVRGAASLVIYANGSLTIGAWGSDVTMTPSVVAVRQNLYPLVVNGSPSALAATRDWLRWGGTCPCGKGQHGVEHQWRSGLGITADGALVYVVGPKLGPLQVAELLVRAGAVRGMQLDINPTWPVFASFKPTTRDGLAAASNGARLIATYRGPATFFDPTYARDFITMSAAPGSRLGRAHEEGKGAAERPG